MTLEWTLILLLVAMTGAMLLRGRQAGSTQPRVTATNTVVSLFLGVGFLAYGLFSVVQIHRSGHDTVTGKIASLSEWHSRSGAHATFNVVRADGVPFFLRAHYGGPELQDGSVVTAEFMDWNYNLVDLTVLSGPSAGWHHSEDGGMDSSYLLVVLGAFMLIMAGWRRSKAKDEEAVARPS